MKNLKELIWAIAQQPCIFLTGPSGRPVEMTIGRNAKEILQLLLADGYTLNKEQPGITRYRLKGLLGARNDISNKR